MDMYVIYLETILTFKKQVSICLLNNIQDEEAKRSPNDELNNFPELKLILESGGCAYYEFPVNPGEMNSFIQPARKLRPGELYEVGLSLKFILSYSFYFSMVALLYFHTTL